jgi:hypothetical protein
MNLLSQAAERIGRNAPRSTEDRALLERLGQLGDRDGFTLTHALSVAAERFDEDARTFREQKVACEAALEAGGRVAMFTPEACEQLAKQFERQAADTRALIAVIQGDGEEEEAEAA